MKRLVAEEEQSIGQMFTYINFTILQCVSFKHTMTIWVLGFVSRWRLGIFLFTMASRTGLGPSSLLFNGYEGLFPWE
jgi:hypothetical protein